ncbi:plastocyanin/azurin family copper-binding protein [Streptosporangium sp. NPDC000396]|uniref:plastocyanin/azurin family copper-binding protein n=1 Tax=Streptosporangium sp. NPDC000396 TaxID=3366185 RepID=UPI0036C5067B
MFAAIRSRGRPGPAMGLVAAALTLAVCGGTTVAVTPQAWASDTPVKVTEREFSIGLSKKSLSPGTYTFKIKNVGTVPHGLSVKGPGVDSTSSIVPGGKATELTVTLKKGKYRLWCPVDKHRAMGMVKTIKVR